MGRKRREHAHPMCCSLMLSQEEGEARDGLRDQHARLGARVLPL